MKFRSDKQRKAVFANLGHGFSQNPNALDGRSRKRKAIDRSKAARKRFKPYQVAEWSKQKTHSDLVGYDTKVRIHDTRSMAAINEDRMKQNSKVLRLTRKNYLLWKKNPGKYDLAGWDTKMPVKHLTRFVKEEHRKRRKVRGLHAEVEKSVGSSWKVEVKGSGFRKKQVRSGSSDLDSQKRERLKHYVKQHVSDPQTVDVDSLIDSSLNYAENKEILRKILEPTAKDFIGSGIVEPPMSFRGIKPLGWKSLGKNSYESMGKGDVDFSVRKEGDRWVLDSFDSKKKNPNEAYIISHDYDSLKEAQNEAEAQRFKKTK